MIKEKKHIKKELRILGIDDGPFNKFRDKTVLVVATVFRGGSYIDGLLSTKVIIDGIDSTNKLIQIVKKNKTSWTITMHYGWWYCFSRF